MFDKYGPQTKYIKRLLDEVYSLNQDQITDLQKSVTHSTNRAAEGIAWRAAISVSHHPAGDAIGETVSASSNNAWDAAAQVTESACKNIDQDATSAIRGVSSALAVRDRIGGKFTQEHYDVLTKPWRKIVGSIHPDDKNLI
jgi:hypothetical protein